MDIVRNDTLLFLLPLLSDSKFNRHFFMNKHFIGAFVGDIDRNQYEHEIALAYEAEHTLKYHEFEFKLSEHPLFTKIRYSYEKESVHVFIFKIPLELEIDYDMLLSNEHSSISPASKLKIAKFWNIEYKTHYSLYKTLFDKEYCPPGFKENDYEKELFDILKI